MLRKYKLHCFLNINIKFSYCFLHLFYTKNLNVIEAERLQIENKEIQTQDFHSNFLFFFFSGYFPVIAPVLAGITKELEQLM